MAATPTPEPPALVGFRRLVDGRRVFIHERAQGGLVVRTSDGRCTSLNGRAQLDDHVRLIERLDPISYQKGTP